MRAVYPPSVSIEGQAYAFDRILKDDFFSLNILYKNQANEGYVLKLSDFRFLLGWVFRPVAGWISRREYAIYRMVADIPGVPALGPRYGKRGYFHRFIEGKTLYEIERRIHTQFNVLVGHPTFGNYETSLAPDFFDQLIAIIQEVHQRRIFYADLNKRGNIICSTEGKPYLIDFQICLHLPVRKGWMGVLTEKMFQRLVREDLYHLYKHKKTFQPQLMTEKEQQLAQRSNLNRRYRRLLWRPYIVLKRLIYPHGSNETIWYKWKKRKDQSPQMP
jgi:serine/threonine protein kinase